ncbi:MAG: ABC transporter ATP-binding protein [Clostridia bacterium]|nr:ABC transporter ATP-binding protein [Clostridia bacterium]
MENLLEVKNLRTVFHTYAGTVFALNGVSFSLKKGEALAIVGESGSGKSVTMLSVMKLLSENGQVSEGNILFNNQEIRNLSTGEMQKIRGNEIGMVFQDPMTSLNPVLTVGSQLIEVIMNHNRISKGEALGKAVEMLKLVGIPSPEKRIKQYPFEFSGGMRQRVMIATALCCEPKLLIADEPTTALDVTIQAQILELMKKLKERTGMSIILITHDLGLVTDICDKIVVMYGGTVVEQGTVEEIFHNPVHPYTLGLLQCIPRLNMGKERLKPIEGHPPDLIHPPPGCPFAERCPKAMKICEIQKPYYKDINQDHSAACWLLYEFCEEGLT